MRYFGAYCSALVFYTFVPLFSSFVWWSFGLFIYSWIWRLFWHVQVRTKVQKLKDTRDYSFLLSDDAQTPAPAKVVAPQRPATVPSSGTLLNYFPFLGICSSRHCIFIEETYTGFLLMLKRQDKLKCHRKVSKVWWAAVDQLTEVTENGNWLLQTDMCILKQDLIDYLQQVDPI